MTVDPMIFETIPWHLDLAEVLKRVRLDPADPDADEVRRLLGAAHAIGRPKAVYREAFIDARVDDTVTIDAVPFASRVLRVNLEQAQQVFAYLATCGTELESWAAPLDDPLERYWADAIMELALRKALHYLNERIGEIIPHNRTSVMNPGSLRDWPITQQRPLFALIGPAAARVGITLTESLLMTPAKSVSGIRFATDIRFENCQICPRVDCPNRHSPYDKALYQRKYGRTE
jgi:hypothetical protein